MSPLNFNMDKYRLPTSTTINGKEVPFRTDYRDILRVFEAMNDPDLLDNEKVIVSLRLFYENDDWLEDIECAIKSMYEFITNGDAAANESETVSKPLFSWEQDFNIIIAPINRVMSTDVRGLEYLHWWTFLSAFMEIGECTFSTYVSIRDKLNKGKKLEKHEQRIYKENRDKIVLKKKVDSTTQSLMDEIMGL